MRKITDTEVKKNRPPLYSSPCNYIESKRIQDVVDAVEKKKNYKRDPNLITRHMLEELGELSHALYI